MPCAGLSSCGASRTRKTNSKRSAPGVEVTPKRAFYRGRRRIATIGRSSGLTRRQHQRPCNNHPMEEKHSGLGVTSFIISVTAGILLLLLFTVAGLLRRHHPAGPYPAQFLVGLSA